MGTFAPLPPNNWKVLGCCTSSKYTCCFSHIVIDGKDAPVTSLPQDVLCSFFSYTKFGVFSYSSFTPNEAAYQQVACETYDDDQ
jgi:hypothetical protein